ncbi:N-6 DNA methylase [Methanobacterium formicicum]|uniref:N-6 DNA methylase n=1 Tax=Methanobacterium formicicum TaxID=2162 RepID=UPI002492EA31|nr:N-6 DNA methylase [Methanobacterium formicicum]
MDVPSEFKHFHNLIGKLTDKHDLAQVFDDWMEYIVMGHLTDNSMKWEKSYTKPEIQILWEMYKEFTQIMNRKLVTDTDWFDFPGSYYEPCISTPYQREKAGQFFTPPDICKLMAMMNLGNSTLQPGMKVNDPTAGSGRNLLAVHVLHPGCYKVAEDIDYTCILMCLVNFLVHGVVGEVIWHDTITQDFFGAWKVNETLNPMGFPSIRSLPKEEYNLSKMATESSEKATLTIKPTKQSTLGGLF